MATPSMKFPGFAEDTSITLNFERSGDTWMFRFQPHPVPQPEMLLGLAGVLEK
jgi:hypothetical protein